MGTEKTSALKSSHRAKPPPVPPRPHHLPPTKTMSKFSSMPDILNGWKRDTSTNPDLLKLGDGSMHSSKKSIVDIIRPDCVKINKITNGDAYPGLHHGTSNEYLADKSTLIMSNYGGTKSRSGNYAVPAIQNGEKNDKNDGFISKKGSAGGGSSSYGKTSRKLSCLPSRSNSKKKQEKNCVSRQSQHPNDSNDGNRYENKSMDGKISQTSWYVEDVQLSDVVNVDTTKIIVPNPAARYTSAVPAKPAAVDCCAFSSYTNKNNDDDNCRNNRTKDNVNNVSQRTHRNLHQQSLPQLQPPQPRPQRTKMSTAPVLSGLPPLPRSLSDASLLWENTNKNVSGHPMSPSPARSASNASPSRTRRHIVHPKVPPPAVPRSNSVPSDDQPKISAVYVNSLSVGGKKIVTSWPIEGDSTILREERPPPPPPPRKPTSLDMKLSILRKEMHVLRQMDLSLLSQLWSLNESIHEFRQRQELLSPNCTYLNSSDEDDSGCYHSTISSLGMVTSNHHNTLGSSSSRSSISTTGRSTHLHDATKP